MRLRRPRRAARPSLTSTRINERCTLSYSLFIIVHADQWRRWCKWHVPNFFEKWHLSTGRELLKRFRVPASLHLAGTGQRERRIIRVQIPSLYRPERCRNLCNLGHGAQIWFNSSKSLLHSLALMLANT